MKNQKQDKNDTNVKQAHPIRIPVTHEKWAYWQVLVRPANLLLAEKTRYVSFPRRHQVGQL